MELPWEGSAVCTQSAKQACFRFDSTIWQCLRLTQVNNLKCARPRFEDQLPCRTGPQTHHSRCNVQQNKDCIIQISKFKFSLVISGLTKILQRINELRPTHAEFERDYYESLLIVMDTLEKCLSSQVVKFNLI